MIPAVQSLTASSISRIAYIQTDKMDHCHRIADVGSLFFVFSGFEFFLWLLESDGWAGHGGCQPDQ